LVLPDTDSFDWNLENVHALIFWSLNQGMKKANADFKYMVENTDDDFNWKN